MVIVVVSNLSGDPSSGLTYSVPARIKALEEIDDVLWINLTESVCDNWKAVKSFHKISEYGDKMSLKILPEQYKRPDIVVLEDFYYLKTLLFSYELRRKGIPYIIVPRSNLTYLAQHNKAWLKKKISNFLLFYRFAQKALCIQYLTDTEKSNSSDKWNKRYIIVPNGITMPDTPKASFSEDGIKSIFIGRLNAYHKGLDLLLEAIYKEKGNLIASNFSLIIYGKENRDFEILKEMVNNFELWDIVSFGGEITGREKEEAILKSDLFIMTSRFEGHPMGLIEALSYGLPCLVSDGTNMAKEIYDADAGWMCEGNVESIQKALLMAVGEKNLYSLKSYNAVALAKKYNWEKLARRFHDEVNNLLSQYNTL